MKKVFYIIMAIMPALLVSCGKEAAEVSDPAVAVRFQAELPQAPGTRADAAGTIADKVYCTVFENGAELTSMRQELQIQDGKGITYSPSLLKGHTYNIVFWACKSGSYDVTDLKSITRTAGHGENEYDAFTAVTTIEVSDTETHTITLKRPMAQLNLGVSQKEWDLISDKDIFNITPSKTVLKLSGKSAFNALTGASAGSDAEIIYELPATGEEITSGSQTYRSIGMCLIMAETEKQTTDITFSVYDQNGKTIRQDVTIRNIPLQRNYKTNVVGEIMTETITYSITLEEAFNQSGHTQEIR